MTFKSILIASSAALLLAACGGAEKAADKTTDTAEKTVEKMASQVEQGADSAKLAAILAMQDDKAKARYDARNPQATLEFFGIEPGMTVVEALPGGGWYSKILIPYLGEDGHLVGVDYSIKMWPEFGGFATPEFIEQKKTWPADWVQKAKAWDAGDAKLSAFTFGARDTSMDGQADAVLFIRAMHNLSRFEDQGAFMTEALTDAYALLKPGGIVGIVQHAGPEENDDDWANGSNGYLKQSTVIAAMEEAGFELVAESDINANPKDVPSNDEIVWRLPPSLGTSGEDADLRAKMQEIGESNRMTLLFKKK